jgi:ankyrin repeat protein
MKKNNLITVFERFDNVELMNLFRQIKYNNLNFIKQFIEENPSKINILNSNKFTLLIEAVHKNKTDIIDYLLTTDIDIDFQDNYGMTALIKASAVNNLNITKKLIGVGVDLNIQDKYGRTALLKIIDQSFYDPYIAYELIDAGADLNIQDRYGRTVLINLATKNYKVDMKLVKKLLDNGADTTIISNHDESFFDSLNGKNLKTIIVEYPDVYRKYLISLKSKKFNL